MKVQKSRARRFWLALMPLMLAVMIFASPAISVQAETTYYPTWDEWVEAGMPSETFNDKADAIEAIVTAGKEKYEAGEYDDAYTCVRDAYNFFYETSGFERNVNALISGSRVTAVELQFSVTRKAFKNQQDDALEQADTLIEMIRTDANQLDGVPEGGSSSSSESSGDSSSGSSSVAAGYFTGSFAIILREGFEAILIVGAIIAYLNKEDSENKKSKLRQVYAGSVLGIVMSFVLAWIINLLRVQALHQELIEGVTALLAVCVLYYVSNWMLSKSESDAWNQYIKNKASESSEKGSTFALALTAFLAVFREGAEVVLFYQPLLSEGYASSVLAGFIVGCVILVFVYLAIRYLGLRIPIKPFFITTSIIMFVMSISFLGAGINELIEGDFISPTTPEWLSWIPEGEIMTMLGIHPILETLIPQLILLVITIVIFVITTRKNNAIHAEAEARRAEERAKLEAEQAKKEAEEFEAKVREIVVKVINEMKE